MLHYLSGISALTLLPGAIAAILNIPENIVQCSTQTYNWIVDDGVELIEWQVVDAARTLLVERWTTTDLGSAFEWNTDIPSPTAVYFNLLQNGNFAYQTDVKVIASSNKLTCFESSTATRSPNWQRLYGGIISGLGIDSTPLPASSANTVQTLSDQTTPPQTSTLLSLRPPASASALADDVTIADKGLKGWHIALICLAVVLILIVLGLLFFLLRKRNSARSSPQQSVAACAEKDFRGGSSLGSPTPLMAYYLDSTKGQEYASPFNEPSESALNSDQRSASASTSITSQVSLLAPPPSFRSKESKSAASKSAKSVISGRSSPSLKRLRLSDLDTLSEVDSTTVSDSAPPLPRQF